VIKYGNTVGTGALLCLVAWLFGWGFCHAYCHAFIKFTVSKHMHAAASAVQLAAWAASTCVQRSGRICAWLHAALALLLFFSAAACLLQSHSAAKCAGFS
jgi:hypothetical protein